MKILPKFLFIILLFSFCFFSCIPSETKKDDDGSAFEGVGKCTASRACQDDCNSLFIRGSSLSKKCLASGIATVDDVDDVISAMKKGSWKSISASELESFTQFDKDLWAKYSGVNKEYSRGMLSWIAEDPEVGKILNDLDDDKILQKAFETLGQPKTKAVLEGMKSCVEEELSKKQSFFELVSLENDDGENNPDAFHAGHRLLREECDNDISCVREVYCAINQTVVFRELNFLNLAKHTGTSELHSRDCPSGTPVLNCPSL